jgi:hypothetical protein
VCAQLLCKGCGKGDGTGAAKWLGHARTAVFWAFGERVVSALGKLFRHVCDGVTFGSGHCRIMIEKMRKERDQERKTEIVEKDRQQFKE